MKYLFRALLCFLISLFFFSNSLTAQVKFPDRQSTIHRCATDEAIELRYRTDPAFKAMMDQRERDFQAWRLQNPNNPNTPSTLTGPVTIPVVVHIVLPDPNIILESDVEYFINRLNLDFSGLNPDSTNGAPFYGVRGHSLIRWALAKRDPSGNFTSGIERRAGAGTIGSGEPQAIKSFASGGLNPWPVAQYYNVWVGVGGGLLGIAPEIGPGTATSDGVCVNYQAFANNSCYTIGAFNLGRTGVHEIGHNFGLFHTFQGGCSNSDNGQLTSAGCQLPGSILGLADQTPAQSASTSGCPAGAAAAGCASSPNPPGKQYQNYMDYTDDACYSMFTNTQVERMHWVLENCRAGYLTSTGAQLPAGTPALDGAAFEIVSPGGSELVGCTVITYNLSGCSPNFTPKLRVQNRGSSTLTSITVQFTLNGTPAAPQTIALNIPYGKSQVVTLNSATAIPGNNTFSFTVSAPNGGSDGNAANNTISGNLNYAAPTINPLPVTQDFTGTTFPPSNITIVNPNGNNTWVRNANGSGNAGSAFIDNYNFNLVGQTDDIRTLLLTSGSAYADSLIFEFDLAHKNFPGFNDRLQVLVSSDCGSTFTTAGTNPVFDRAGAVLATAGSSTANYTTPAAGDWRHQRIAIFVGCGSPFATSGTIMIALRATNGYGNNIFVDNISVTRKDITLFLAPTATQPGCGLNNGSITINTVAGPAKDYSINGGTTWQASSTFTGLASGNYNLAVRYQATPSCVYLYPSNPFVLNSSTLPVVNQPSDQVLCNAAATAAVTFSGSPVPNTVYNWTNNTPSIGLAPSGSGDIASFAAVNTGNAPVVATITVTPVAGPCTGNSKTFTITVNPTPKVTATPLSQSLCTGNAIVPIVLTGTVTGSSLSWTRTNTINVTGIAASGSGNITGTLVNTTSTPQTVTFAVTPSANGCTGTVVNPTVVVNPYPTVSLASSGPTALTPGQTVSIIATTNPPGGSFVWYVNNSVVSGATTSTLNNLTVDNVGIYRTVYTDLNGCTTASGTLVLTYASSGRIWIYPSPNNGTFYVRFYNTITQPAVLSVFDSKGARVFNKRYALVNPYTRMDVDLRNAESGVYRVELLTGTNKRIATGSAVIIH